MSDLFVIELSCNRYNSDGNEKSCGISKLERSGNLSPDTDGESVSDSALFATGFGGITDIEISPFLFKFRNRLRK